VTVLNRDPTPFSFPPGLARSAARLPAALAKEVVSRQPVFKRPQWAETSQ
jgi:hypothetical protein